MEVKDVLNKVVVEAEANPVSNAVFHVLAARERNRSTLNLASLYSVMKKEGFTHTRSQYADVLKFLGLINVGVLNYTKRGRLIGLKDISISLKTMGSVAVNRQTPPVSERKKAEVIHLMNKAKERGSSNMEDKISPLEVPPPSSDRKYVTLYLNHKPFTISIPNEFTKEEVALLIHKFYV